MKEDINENEVEELIQKIEQANRTKMEVLDYIPKSLALKWSQVVTCTLMEWNNAKPKKETLLAIEKWHKLKSVIIKPGRGGEKGRAGAFARWKNNMDDWLTGNW